MLPAKFPSHRTMSAVQTVACLAGAFTLILAWRSTSLVRAQTSSDESGPPAMLVVLKNQPVRQIVGRLETTSGLQRKLAAEDFRRFSLQAGAPDQMKQNAGEGLL